MQKYLPPGEYGSHHNDWIRIHSEASWIHDERILQGAAQNL